MKSRLDCAMPEAGRGVALRVEVDHQHPVAERRQRGAEVDRGGRLADAALLVGDGDDMRFGRGSDTSVAPISTIAASGSVRLAMDRCGRTANARRPRRSPYAPSRPWETSQYPPADDVFPPSRAASSSGASARADTTSAACGGERLDPLGKHGRREARPSRTTVARKAALRWSLSTRRTSSSGACVRGNRRDHEPGETRAGPEVEPEPGARRAQAARAAPNRRSAGPRPPRGSPRETRLIRGFHRVEQRKMRLQPRHCFT